MITPLLSRFVGTEHPPATGILLPVPLVAIQVCLNPDAAFPWFLAWFCTALMFQTSWMKE
jgi:hypothetical protein